MHEKPASSLATDAITSLWMSVAAEAGWQVIRTTDAYASSDGAGRISIGVDEVLDADDAPAQLIFHELCHALTQGPSSWSLPDWGLSNADPRAVVAEHACLCVHVLLSSPFGLRAAMAPTTEYRAYHAALKEDDLAVSLEPAPARPRALGGTGRVSGLRSVLPRGIPLGDGVRSRSGGVEATRLGRPSRASLRDPPRGAPLRGARRSARCAGAIIAAVLLRHLRRSPAPLPRLRGERQTLPGGAPSRGVVALNSSVGSEIELFVPLDDLAGGGDAPARLLREAERTMGRAAGSLGAVRVLRRSLDARKNRPLGYRLRCLVAERASALEASAQLDARPVVRWPVGRRLQ